MDKIFKTSLLVLALLATGTGFSQKREIAKANKEFDKYAYIDARKIYLQVVEDGYESAELYERLGDTYYWNSDYDNAAKWYKKLLQRFPEEAKSEYYYRAAQSLKSLERYKESDSIMAIYATMGDKGLVIKNFKDDPDYLKSIAFGSKSYELEKVSVNTPYSDFGPAYFGDKLVYASSSLRSEGGKIAQWNDQPFLDLFETQRDSEGRLSYPQPLSGEVNTPYHESTPTFSKDGKTMFFTRNNFLDGKKGKDKDKTIRLTLYKATKGSEGLWGNVTELPFNSKEYSTAHPALSPDEKRLYFASDMPGTMGMSDLWYVDILPDNNYGTPVNLGPTINTEARESFPFISEKNNLYFASDGHAGLGGFDVYVTPLDTMGKPGEATNLGEPANSNQDDFGFIIKEDEYVGYMSSNRDGNRGSIDDEIYRVQEKCEVTITGLVFDKDTKDPLPDADVTLLNDVNAVVGTLKADASGNFNFMADCEKQYSIRAVKELYFPNEVVITTPAVTGTINVEIPLERKDICDPKDLGCKLNLQPIYFDFDRYNIRPDAEVELAKILAAMQEYPELVIHIESHTDSRGNDAYNEALSEKRAQSTLNWLVGKGIDRNRLSAKGYGEYRLVNECSNGVECTEEEHQLNRRSMFIIQD